MRMRFAASSRHAPKPGLARRCIPYWQLTERQAKQIGCAVRVGQFSGREWDLLGEHRDATDFEGRGPATCSGWTVGCGAVERLKFSIADIAQGSRHEFVASTSRVRHGIKVSVSATASQCAKSTRSRSLPYGICPGVRRSALLDTQQGPGPTAPALQSTSLSEDDPGDVLARVAALTDEVLLHTVHVRAGTLVRIPAGRQPVLTDGRRQSVRQVAVERRAVLPSDRIAERVVVLLDDLPSNVPVSSFFDFPKQLISRYVTFIGLVLSSIA